jgi:hypothetical protein
MAGRPSCPLGWNQIPFQHLLSIVSVLHITAVMHHVGPVIPFRLLSDISEVLKLTVYSVTLYTFSNHKVFARQVSR